jgi:hypothetical protein
LLGLNLYLKYSKVKPNGYFQNWQLEILKSVWENNVSYLIHELGVNPMEVSDWDETYAAEEVLEIWNDLYDRYSLMMPDFKEKSINKLLREQPKTKGDKRKEIYTEEIKSLKLPSNLLKKKIIITDMG